MDHISNYFSFLSDPSLSGSITILAFLFAIWTWVSTRKNCKFSSHSTGSNLISGSFSELPQQVEILYEGALVPQVTLSTFILWNSGNQVITKEHLKTIDPLRIELTSDFQILKYDIIKTNNDTNNFFLKKNDDGKSLSVRFDFLEPKN
ncbi:TPA: hypothetical protein R1156_003610, partial [Yersinia enterocolitica]|nr:hypothetical protein [Yersinia enterocolitica]